MQKNVITKKIHENLKTAIKAKDKVRIGTLRMLLSTLKNAELDNRGELTEEQEIAVLAGYVRRCKESIGEFEKGGRDDLVAKEREELKIVQSYLPEQLSEEEVAQEAKKLIEELGATGPKDIGLVMGEIIKKVKGRADGRAVNRIVVDLLQKGEKGN